MGGRFALLVAVLAFASGGVNAEPAPKEAEDAYTAAVDLHRAGRAVRAARACRELIEEYPDFNKPYYLLAWIQAEQGEPARAARTYRALIERRPAELSARMYRARILLYDLRDYAGAEREYRSALIYADGDEDARLRAEQGLRSVAAERARRREFRDHRVFLRWVVAGLLLGWLAVIGVATRLTR